MANKERVPGASSISKSRKVHSSPNGTPHSSGAAIREGALEEEPGQQDRSLLLQDTSSTRSQTHVRAPALAAPDHTVPI